MAIIGALPVTLTNGTTADATQVMSDFSFIVSQVNANAAPLVGTPQLTALNIFTQPLQSAAATTRAQVPITSQVQDNNFNRATDTDVGANLIVAALSPAITAYQDGATYTIKANATNTAAVTLNINGVGAQPVVNPDNTALVAGQIVDARTYLFTWSSTLAKFIVTATAVTVLPTYDGTWKIKNTADATKIIADSAALITTATTRTRTMPDRDITLADINDRHGSVQLQYTSANAITLVPKNGQSLMINGVMYRIPGAGIVSGNPSAAVNFVAAVANQILAANTVYNVYVFVNSGTLTFDFHTTGHAADATTGVEVLSGSPTRTYVGKIVTEGTSHYQNVLAGLNTGSGQAINGVISWFNRREIQVLTAQATVALNASTVFPTWANVGAATAVAMQLSFLSFGDEAVTLATMGAVDHSAGAQSVYVSIGLDSATVAQDTFQQIYCDTAGAGYPFHASIPVLPSEGLHVAYQLGAHSAATGQYVGAATAGQRNTLTAMIRG